MAASPLTGARSPPGLARSPPKLAAGLLAAAVLLPAPSAQAQHLGYEVTLSPSDVITEGQTVTVSLRCTSYCNNVNLITDGGSGLTESTLRADVSISPATLSGVSLSGTVRLSTASTNTNGAWTGPVTISTTNDAVNTGPRTLTVSASPDLSGDNGAWAVPDTFSITPATLTINDDDAPVNDGDAPGLVVSKDEAETTEAGGDGQTDEFTVRLGDNPQADVEVEVSSRDSDECEVSLDGGGRYLGAGESGTLTFVPDGEDDSAPLTSEWDEAQPVTVQGVDDRADDGAQRCAVRLDPSSAGDPRYEDLDAVEVSVTNADNDVSAALSLSPSSIGEGGTATVTAMLPAPAASAVTLTVSAAPGTGAKAGDFTQTGTTLTIAAGATASTGSVTIAAADDAVDGPETRQVTVSATSSGGGENTVNPSDVSLAIADDDAAPQAALALAPAVIGQRAPYNVSAVTATLARPSSEATVITVSARGERFALSANRTLTVAAGSTASTGTVTLTAEDAGEQAPDREVIVSGRAENVNGVEQPEAVALTIRSGAGAEVTEALLPEAARAMADSRAAAVRRRLEGAAAATELPALTEVLAKHGPSVQDDSLDWKKALAGSSFALSLNAAGGGGSGGGITAWGSGDYRDLDGEARGVSWDGDVASAHLGLDRKLANGLRVGLAASWSGAKFDYEHYGLTGEWELEMTSAQPYLGWTTPGGLELWASAGAGSGDLEIAAGGAPREKSDADMWLAAAGARKPLHETASGLRVSLRGEALYSSFEVDGNGRRIQAYTADASRLRLALEARRDRVLASGARLSPRFELGLRHDGGDGETGAGVELGGGAEYASGRLTASGGARVLAANSDYDEWGADLALAYAPGADGRGFSFRLAPSWGTARSGAQKLWERGAPGLNGTADESDPGARLEAELGYGLKSPWSRGLLTLTLGGEAGGDAGAACRLKGAVALDATASLGLELAVRDPKRARPSAA